MNRLFYLLSGDARLLDVERYHSVRLETVLPLWVTFFLAVGAIWVARYLYRRVPPSQVTTGQRRTLTALRAAAYLALLLIALQPRLAVEAEGRPTGPLPVIFDRTESLSIKDQGEQTRVEAGLAFYQQVRRETARGVRQVPYLYGADVRAWAPAKELKAVLPATPSAGAALDAPPTPPPAAPLPPDTELLRLEGSQTSLNDMLDGGLREHTGVYCPGVLLVTDGAHNVPDDLDRSIRELVRRRIPVYTVVIGKLDPKDVALNHVLGEEIVFKEEKARFFVSLNQRGYTGKPLPVKAFLGSNALDVAPVTPEHEGETIFPIEFTAATEGVYDLVVEVPPDRDEVTDRNNRVSRKLRVIKDRIRVLLAFGVPSWEYRFLNGAFERDRRVEHKCYLQSLDPRLLKLAPGRYLATLPASPDALFRAFDLVILGRLRADGLPAPTQQLLRDFVADEGGGLVVLADGADLPYSLKGTTLEGLLPLTIPAPTGESSFRQEMFKSLTTPYQLELAEDGIGNPLTTFHADRAKNLEVWRAFPPHYEVVTDGQLKPSAIPLVNAYVNRDGPRYPAVVYHNYGKGTVLYLAFDATWRWRKEHGDRYHRDFWGKVVQFLGLPHLLGETAQARVFTDSLSAAVASRVVVTAVIRNRDYSPYIAESVPVRVHQEGVADREVVLLGLAARPGIFRGTLFPEQPGVITLRLPERFQAEAAELAVEKVDREFLQSGVNEPLVRQLARETKGDLFLPGAPLTTVLEDETPLVEPVNDPPRLAQLNREREARLARRRALARDVEQLAAKTTPVYAAPAYLGALARHVLQTISERRLPTPISVEASLWDAWGLWVLAALLFCVEYFLRKRWYLD